MKYRTRDFGEVEVAENRIIEFVHPILGFEEYKKYTLLYDEEIGAGIVWLQCLENENLCFLLADPTLVLGYEPVLSKEQLLDLGDGEYLCLPIIIFSKEWEDATVNLKSPIVINTTECKAMQIVLPEDYPIRKKLFGGKENA